MSMRIVRGLLALLVLVASLAGVPSLLVAMGHYPTVADLSWEQLLLAPDDGRVLLWLVTALGWVAWLLFTVVTALDVAALLGRPSVRLPGLRWLQGVSATLLVAVLLMLGANDHHGGASGAVPVVATAHAVPLPVVAQAAPVSLDDHVAHEPVANGTASPDPGPNDAAAGPVEDAAALVEYTVVRGDDLWTLAQTHLGHGTHWRQIFDLNRELLGGDPEHLEPGWVLRLPAPLGAPAPPSAPAAPAPPAPEPAQAVLAAPAPAPATPAPATPAPTMPEIPLSTVADEDPGPAERARLLGGTGVLLAGGLTALLAGRRHRQLVQRPLGTIPRPVAHGTDRIRSALLSTPIPPAFDLVEWAVHMVARAALAQGRVGQLDWLRAGPSGIEFRWSAPDEAPWPFTQDGCSWTVDLSVVLADREGADDEHQPWRLWPTLVTIGTAGEDTYLVDLERWGRVSVQADSAERGGEILTSYLMELATSPWAGAARVTLVGDDGGFVDAGEAENVVRFASPEEALPVWESAAATQQALAAVADAPIPLLRLDPDLAEAWAPQVLVLLDDITPAQRSRLTARFSREVRGPLVLLSEHPGGDAALLVDESPLRGAWEPAELQVTPQLVPRTVRDAVVELARATAPEALVPAPWAAAAPDSTAHPDSTAPEELAMTDDPRLLLLGPVVLEGARGLPPTRAPRQCLEYCAYLLEHPAVASVQMARALMVAEATRRSNMSRLRGWLGTTPAGEPYLPEAYSGRIRLHPAVRSDWQEVQILLGRGVELASDATLVAILQLVRGAPLADAPPGGWTWAEELRISASCAVRDVAYALAGRALEVEDVDLARWAIGRGLVAAPNDEALLRRLLVCEGRTGDRRQVERLVFRLNAQARDLGVDLLPETVVVMQEVLEGGIRARATPGASHAHAV